MKAISIKQPWASLVAAGHKTVECRSWKTPHRGPLLICSSQGDVEINDGMVAPGGMALGVVELLDIRRMEKVDVEAAFLPDDPEIIEAVLQGYAWHVKKLYEIVPFAVKGRLNLYDVEDTLLHRLPSEYADHCDYLSAKGLMPTLA